ncbi:hypothetical protein [Rubrivirga sp.]|uniref:hypothetical protein n=1 Tax=Rubrivirga sp. TaxID=1885344 RepID=UPI003B52BBEB
MRLSFAVSLAVVVALAGCGRADDGPTPGLGDLPPVPDTPPAWAASAVWYEIDVDRFRNGDPSNDPTPASVAGDSVSVGALLDAGWQPAAWTSDWTARADWERALGDPATTVPLRRYGGDLQGVIDRLPALDTLGVTALVLRVADARAPHHVDPHLGPRPTRDREATGLETPGDPETWGTTQADVLLLDLVEAAHARGVRVVLDVAWPGSLAASSPADADSAEANALAVAVRWLDPDGDGDPADGVDGFRLDADAGSANFRGALRRVVKAVQPRAVLVGRVDGSGPGTDGGASVGAFDALADGRAFATLRQLLDPAGPQISPADAAAELADLYAATAPDHLPSFWSVAGTPGGPRLLTALANANVLNDDEATPTARPGYDASRPGPDAARAVELYRLLQATLPGAPHVRAGDEVGVWGARAPDDRRPMRWDDLDYAPEADDSTRAPVPVVADRNLRASTSQALRARRAHTDLFARGTLVWEPMGDVLRFARQTERERAVVVVNLGTRPARQAVDLPLAFHVGPRPSGEAGTVVVAPRSGAVFVDARGRP